MRARSAGLIDLSLPVGPRRRARVVERPGLWMTAAELDALRDDLRTVAASTLSAPLDYGVFRPGAPLDDVIVTLVHQDDRPIAFNALAPLDVTLGPHMRERVLHLGLVMVDPTMRSGGLSWVLYGLTCFLVFARGGFRPLHVSSVTQVPAVIGMVAETFGDVFPDPRRPSRPRLRQRVLARRLVATHARAFGVGPEARFDEARFVIENGYTGGSEALKKSFEEAVPHRDERFNAYARQTLDYARGDDVVQLGRIDLPTARDYLRRQVPRRRVAGLVTSALATAGFALAGRLVLPVAHWFDTSRTHGTLRRRSDTSRAHGSLRRR